MSARPEAVVWPALPGFPPGSLPERVGGLLPLEAAWPGGAAVGAAVVMLLIPPEAPDAAGPARVVFMRRSLKVRSHRGQISFAGGRAEPGDPSPVATALRELDEELGVPPAHVVPVGALPFLPSLGGSPVRAVVAVAAVPLTAMRPAPDEVDHVFAEPWPAFRRAAAQSFSFNIFGNWRRSLVFHAGGRTIWGLTAHLLHSADLG